MADHPALTQVKAEHQAFGMSYALSRVADFLIDNNINVPGLKQHLLDVLDEGEHILKNLAPLNPIEELAKIERELQDEDNDNNKQGE